MNQFGDKFSLHEGRVLDHHGQPIPEEEPLMLFRAQDRLLPEVIRHYLALRSAAGSPPTPKLERFLSQIEAWQKAAPNRTKLPD